MTSQAIGRAPNGAGPVDKLKRGITGPLLFAFILGDVLGAGIYALMGVLSAQVGGALWAPLLVALLLALLTAGSYAELVTKYPRAGGAAVFAERAFRRPLVSFLVGFSMLAAGVTSAAGLSLAFSGDYLATLVEAPAIPAAIVFLALVAALNARGIRESMNSNVVMTVIELSGLLIVIIAGAVMVGRGRADIARVVEFPAGSAPAMAILGGAIIAYYSFVGFETSANVVEEIRNPSRIYPMALFASLVAAGAIYVLVGLASGAALAPQDLSRSSGPLLEVVSASGLGVPAWAFSAIALVAVANGALLTMIMSSRLAFGMAEHGLLPRQMGLVLPQRRTPWVAILVTTVVAIVAEALGGFGQGSAEKPTGWALTVPSLPGNVFDAPDFGTVGQFNLLGSFSEVGVVAAILLVFTLLLADFFDTMGTMTAIGAEAGLLDADGAPPRTWKVRP